MTSVVDLLEDTAFRQAVRIAKGLAISLEHARLEVGHVVVGLERARQESGPDRFEGTTEWLPALAAEHAAEFGIHIEALWPASDDKMPLSPDLRNLIGQSSGEGLAGLLARLRPATAGARLEEDPAYKSLLHAAYTVAEAHEEPRLTLELLLAGASLAHRFGALSGRPTLGQAVSVTEQQLSKLLAKRGWRLPDSIRTEWTTALPPDASLSKALVDSAGHPDPLLMIMNHALRAGFAVEARERTAYHEAGHTVTSLLLRPEALLSEVTLGEGGVDGHVKVDASSNVSGPEWSREDYLETVEVMLAGRAAERRLAGALEGDNDGAVSDLEQATLLAWNCITRLGFDHELGPVNLAALMEKAGVSQGPLVDLAQKRLQQVLREAETRVEQLLEQNWGLVVAVAQLLMDKGRLTHDDILTAIPALSRHPAIPARRLGQEL